MTAGNIIILGETGRNFAAGMSGGIAYVYDVQRGFDVLCNKEMVDFDLLENSDEKFLHEMISKHYQYTNSTIAGFVLNDFTNQLKNFVKVFPKDYKKVLQQTSKPVNEDYQEAIITK
jgi:glutamate synthase (NADPH/NADH) large chain